MTHQTRLEVHDEGLSSSGQEVRAQHLSKSLEKPFLRMKNSPVARNAYVTAEVTTALAHQIRSIRVQRGWSQLELAKKLGTTQTAISRIEDPSYGRLTLSTLLELSKIFDTGLEVKFVSMVTMLQNTYFVQASDRSVPAFEEECQQVGVLTPRPDTKRTSARSSKGLPNECAIQVDA